MQLICSMTSSDFKERRRWWNTFFFFPHWEAACVKKIKQLSTEPHTLWHKCGPWGRDTYNRSKTPLSERDVAAVISMIVEDTQESTLEQLLFLHMQGEVSAIPSRPVIVCSAVRCECERRPGRAAEAYVGFGSFSCLSDYLAGCPTGCWSYLAACKGIKKRVAYRVLSVESTKTSFPGSF